MAKIEGKYKNGSSKISDEDFKKERELEEKYNKDWDEADRKYNQDVRDLKKESGKGNRFTRAIGDAVRKSAEEYAHDNSLEAEYERKKAEQDMQNNKIVKNAQRTKNAKGMPAKLDEMVGAGALKTSYEEEAKYHDRMARTYKNESLRKEHEIAAQNARIKAEYEAKRSEQYQKGGMKAAKQAGHDFLYGDQDYMNMKYIDATGKETTRGKEALRSAIFSTVFDIAIDAVIGPTPSSSDSSNNTNYAWKFTEHYNDAKNYYRNK